MKIGDFADHEVKSIKFNKEFIPLILSGKKTQTRRMPKGFKKVQYAKGDIVKIDGEDIKISITDVRHEALGKITNSDILKEGFSSWDDFYDAFCLIYPNVCIIQDVTVIEFEVIK